MKLIIESLSQITEMLGSHLSVATLMTHIGQDKERGTSFQSLSEFLRSEGFENTLSQRALADIPLLTVPVVIILKNEEAAIITKIQETEDGRLYTIQQVDGLSHTVTPQELDETYIGYCWFVKSKEELDVRSELPEYTLPKNWFFKVIWRFRKYYYQVVIASILINFLALVSSLYVMNVYDRVIPNKNYNTLSVLTIGVVIAIGFEFLTKIVRGKLTDIAGKKADLIISAALFRRVMGMRLQERPVSSGSYASNLRDFESVRDFMTSASLLTLVDLPFLLLFLFVIWMVAGYLAVVPAIIIPIVIIMGILVQAPMAKYINESMRESSQRQGLSVEAIDGVETLKTNNAYSWAQKRWENFTAKAAASSMKVKNVSNFIVFFSVSMQQLNTVFLVLLGTFLIHAENPDNRITMGALIASVILSGRALAPLGQIAGLATRFQQALLAFKGVSGIIDKPTERDGDRKYVTLKQVKGSLCFDKINFSYDQEAAPALKDFNLQIKPGEKVGILGRVGSGKSTALKVAAGLYDAASGAVTLDDVDLRQIDPSFLRNQVLLLEQNPRLFLGTLRENMDLARMDGFSSNQDLIDALVRFGLQKMIQSHPRGLDMPIGEGGLGLSGGQRQLVALARMTMRAPKVVLLDEPTTGLDQGTEVLALQSIARWAANKTLIVVTHRPQVLRLVDRLVVVENGAVLIDGPRDKVLDYLRENDKKKNEQSTSLEAAAQSQAADSQTADA
ncbi:MAG: type I secretion system permease/ATPase [Gammaproteobacteria bacterium]|nr:MAG: type I secretion system permease/ATPase [Gammaproteobacteria bacterium]